MRRLVLSAVFAAVACAQQQQSPPPIPVNYDEAKAGGTQLPDPLKFASGEPVRNAADWKKRRREIFKAFEAEVFGAAPASAPKLRSEVLAKRDGALNGTANWRETRVWMGEGPDAPYFDILLVLPANVKGPVPVFLGLNFGGNHAAFADPQVRLTTRWVRAKGNKATEESRGAEASRWPADLLVASGFGMATIYYGDFFPDHAAGYADSIIPRFSAAGAKSANQPGQWNAIAAWAWGLSRGLDFLQTQKEVDPKRVAVIGHSRLGKTALWAGAADERFAMVVSNDSGEGGAALSRRNFGETIAHLNRSFPHWFTANYKKYDGRPEQLPVDHHMLLALAAPRPLYVASAFEDQWADPKGEFLGALHASPVYRLLGTEGLPAQSMPPIDTPVMGRIGYHVRTGKHDINRFDWQQFIAFAKKHWAGK